MATPLSAKEQGPTPRRPSTEGSVAAAPSARSQGELPRAPKRPQESYNGQSPNKRAAPDLSSPHSQCVKVYIGDDKSAEPFIIHRPFIFHHSPYFEKVFKELDDSLFVGDGMPSTVYKETNRDAFGLFMRYIYRGTIKDNNNNNPPVKHTVQLWVLAGKIATPALQNAAMESIFENKCVVGVASLLYIYENTEHGSPLRRLAIDQGLVRNCTMESLLSLFRDHLVNLPHDLLADMIVAQKKLLPAGAHLPPCRIADYYVRVVDRRV